MVCNQVNIFTKNNYKEALRLSKNTSHLNIIEHNFTLKNLKIFMSINKK